MTTTNVTPVGGDADLDRHNNLLQALALLQYAAGAEVTAVAAGDVRYIAPEGVRVTSGFNGTTR